MSTIHKKAFNIYFSIVCQAIHTKNKISDCFQGLETRRQAALHRLLCVEENYVELMTAGIQQFSRPLRHCIVTGSQHAALFQNIEKVRDRSKAFTYCTEKHFKLAIV